MTDSIVSGLVQAPAVAALVRGQKEYVDGRAIIHMESMLDASDVVISASSEATGFDAENVKDRVTFGGWKPSAGGSQYITFTGSVGHKANCLTIAGHNLASMGATIDLEYHDGTSWISVLNGYAPTSDAPIMLLFAAIEALAFRVRVNIDADRYPSIAAILLGERLDLQRGIYVGHNPARYSPDHDFLTEESEGGQIIGSVLLSESYSTNIAIKKITPLWFRTYFAPFLVKASRRIPFAFMWNTDDRYKGEVIFGIATNRLSFGNDHKSFMGGDIDMRGLA